MKNEKIINQIKDDLGFKEEITYLIKKYSKDNVIKFNDNISNNQEESHYQFENNRDLFYSLHSVAISIDGIKENNYWNINITLTDTYDFTEILSNDKYNKGNKKYLSLVNILNDFAAISSQYGVIKSYDIMIKFSWSNFNV